MSEMFGCFLKVFCWCSQTVSLLPSCRFEGTYQSFDDLIGWIMHACALQCFKLWSAVLCGVLNISWKFHINPVDTFLREISCFILFVELYVSFQSVGNQTMKSALGVTKGVEKHPVLLCRVTPKEITHVTSSLMLINARAVALISIISTSLTFTPLC